MRFAVVPIFLLSAACGDNQEPERASELWQRVHSLDYGTWARPAAYPHRATSLTAHADAVDIYLNPTLDQGLHPTPYSSVLPDGSIVVKEGYSTGGDLKIVAVMEKTGGQWFFAEYNADGKTLFSGRPRVCIDCHGARENYSDWLYSIDPLR